MIGCILQAALAIFRCLLHGSRELEGTYSTDKHPLKCDMGPDINRTSETELNSKCGILNTFVHHLGSKRTPRSLFLSILPLIDTTRLSPVSLHLVKGQDALKTESMPNIARDSLPTSNPFLAHIALSPDGGIAQTSVSQESNTLQKPTTFRLPLYLSTTDTRDILYEKKHGYGQDYSL